MVKSAIKPYSSGFSLLGDFITALFLLIIGLFVLHVSSWF